MDDFFKAIGAIIVVVVGIVIAIIIRGFVLVKIWNWFIVPTFELPALTIVQALGLSFVLGYLLNLNSVSESSNFAQGLIDTFVSAIITLLLGWILVQFM